MERKIQLLNQNRLNTVLNEVGEGITALTLLSLVTWDDGKVRRSYLKVFSKPLNLGVVNEITGYLLASSCGLPLPSHAGIIRLPEGLLENQDSFLPYGFVVSEAPGNTPTTIFKIEGGLGRQQLNAIMKILENWPHLNEIIAFDDWTANTDRNLQNIVISAPNKIVLIDHSNLPVTVDWVPSALDPSKSYRNILVDLLKIHNKGTLPQKRSIAVAAIQHPNAYQNTFSELEFWWDTFLEHDPSRRRSLEEFLRIRANDGYNRISSNFLLLAV